MQSFFPIGYESAYTGQAANVVARVYVVDGTSALGTLKATITAGWVEGTDGTGAPSGAYVNFVQYDSVVWGMPANTCYSLRVVYTITGFPGRGEDVFFVDFSGIVAKFQPFTLPIPVANLVYQATQQSSVALNVNFKWFQGILEPRVWSWTDPQGNPISLSGKTVKFFAWYDSGDGQTGEIQHDSAGVGGVTITGANNNVVTVTPTSGDLAVARVWKYLLFDSTTPSAISSGSIDIVPTRLAVP